MDLLKQLGFSHTLKRKGVTPLTETQINPEHKHEWELISRTYAPPVAATQVSDKELMERVLFGVTTFLWECPLCRALRKEYVLGSDITQLDELIDKADKYGPQYIQRTDGTTFVLMKYQPPAQAGLVPLR